MSSHRTRKSLISTRLIISAATLVLIAVMGFAIAGSVDARSVQSNKLFVDKIHGETTIWVLDEYYDSMIDDRWGNLVCIAPSHNVSEMLCTELEIIDVVEDDEGNFFLKLDYSMVVGTGFSGLYPFRGFDIGLWFGTPCNGGYIKGFVYPTTNPNPIDHEENIDSLPPGNAYVC